MATVCNVLLDIPQQGTLILTFLGLNINRLDGHVLNIGHKKLLVK